MHGTRDMRSVTCSPGKPLPGQGQLDNRHFGPRPQSMATQLDRGFQFLHAQSSACIQVILLQGPLRGRTASQYQPSTKGPLYPDAVLRSPPTTTQTQHRLPASAVKTHGRSSPGQPLNHMVTLGLTWFHVVSLRSTLFHLVSFGLF
jgi:hypothetical protein